MVELSVITAESPVELGVADEIVFGLQGRLTGLTADTAPGYQQVKAGISEIRKYRTGVERARKELKQSALDWGRKVDAEAKRVTRLLLDVEEPLKLEKQKVDDEVERLRKEKQEAERMAIEAKERAEREAREAEGAAKREAEQKQREAEEARMLQERKRLEAERERLEDERREQQEALEKERQKIAAEREAIETEKRAVLETQRKGLEAKEAVEREAREKEEKAKAAEAERARLAQEKVEATRLAEERKPDRDKLLDFAHEIESLRLKPPQLNTRWGNAVLVEVSDFLQSAVAAAHSHEAL